MKEVDGFSPVNFPCYGNHPDNVLHVHEYPRNDFKNRTTRPITEEEIKKYKKFFKGVKLS